MSAVQQATLCYLFKDRQVLLIRKKRGIGAGKINGPGGKVDPGETPLEGAIREMREEVGVTPRNLELRGELFFHFADGPVVHGLIYVTREFSGELRETPEAVPLWFPVDALPYDEMWEDDRHWMPLLLAGKRFRGAVNVRGDRATSQEIEVLED